MTYYYEVIKDQPVAFYLLDEEGTTVTDYSGYERNAELSFSQTAGHLPLIPNTQIGTKMNAGDTIEYPLIPIWGNNASSYNFSIEMWFYDYGDCKATLFAPVDEDGQLLGSSLSLEDGRLTFSVGNGTSLISPTLSFVATQQVPEISRAHHVVAQYSQSGLSIYLDGIKVSQSDNQFLAQGKWNADPTGFITEIVEGSLLIDGIAIYQTALSPNQIMNHFKAINDIETPLTIANSHGGSLIPVNDSRSINKMSWIQPNNRSWETYTENNIGKDSLKIRLKKIRPAETSDKQSAFADNSLTLSDTQCLYVYDIREQIGSSEGAISGGWYLDSTKHSSGDFCLFIIPSGVDSIGLYLIDGYLTIKHNYINRAGTYEQHIETMDTQATFDDFSKIFFMWSYGVFTVFVNDFSTYFQYNASLNKNFNFQSTQNMVVASEDGISGFMDTSVKQISIWSKIPDAGGDFDDQFNQITTYTLILSSNLSVSQYGFCTFYIDVGGIDDVDQARVVFDPVCSNITTSISYDDSTYTEIENNSLIPDFYNGDSISGDISPEIYLKVEMSTNDSVYDIPELNYIGLNIYTDTLMGSTHNTTLSPYGGFVTGFRDLPIISKYDHNGIAFSDGGGKINVPTLANPLAEDGRLLTSLAPKAIRTVELFLKQNDDSATTELVSANDDDIVLGVTDDVIGVTGIDSLYINTVVSTGGTLSVGEWNHIVFTVENGEYRENIVTNPRLATNSNGWNDSDGISGERIEGPAPFGSYVYQLQGNGSTGQYGINFGVGTAAFPVSPGDEYVGSISLSSEAVSREASIGLIFYDSDGTELSSTYSDYFYDQTYFSLFSVTGTVPTGTSTMGFDIKYDDGIPSGEIHYAANPIVEKSSVLYPYFDGDLEDAEYVDGKSRKYLGIYINEDNSLWFGNKLADVGNGCPFSMKNIVLYEDVLEHSDVVDNYDRWLGRKTVSITDDASSGNDDSYLLPIYLGEDDPRIIDLDPFVISASWVIVST